MTGLDKARETADKLKAEVAAEKETDEKNMEVAKNELATIHENAELAGLYNSAAQVGAANLGGGEMPLLKIHSAGRSMKNELADGTEPQDGHFFYKQEGTQYGGIEAHILTVSRGFYAPNIEEGKKDTYNQLIGGVIIDGDDFKPFVMYLTGKKLQPWWDFAKIASKYTKAKPVSIPMFALTVKMTTDKVPTEKYGKVWVVNFDIVKTEDGSPKLVLDPGKFTFLKDSAESLEEMISSFADSREVKKDHEQVLNGQAVESESNSEQQLDENGIPF